MNDSITHAPPLTTDEQKVLDFLRDRGEKAHLTAVVRRTHLGAITALNALWGLEARNLITYQECSYRMYWTIVQPDKQPAPERK
jgi:DNA-binding IclR family transcriptional regulator